MEPTSTHSPCYSAYSARAKDGTYTLYILLDGFSSASAANQWLHYLMEPFIDDEYPIVSELVH